MTLPAHIRAALVRRVVARAEAIPGGKARGMDPSDFDAKELAKGVKVEQEHLIGGGYSAEEARAKATEIAMDHLAEIPDYYTRLLKMESEAEVKTAKLIKTLWLVTDPTPESEIIDILVGLTDWDRLRNVMVGSGPRWSKERPAFHDDFKSAYADAMTRLRKAHGRDIPDWVLANGGSEGVFRMASRVAAMSRVPEGTLPGFARDIDDRDLKRLRIRWPYSGRGRTGAPTLETTAAHETKAEALREAEQYAKSYKKRTWPGGMASVVAVIEFPDQPNDDESGGVWVAVTNTYYSPS